MLDVDEIVDKMEERGFTKYATLGGDKIQFVSSHMYDSSYFDRTPKRERLPIINVIVDLNKDEFECQYNLDRSINMLKTPICGAVLNDEHFDRIVSQFESQAKWLSMMY